MNENSFAPYPDPEYRKLYGYGGAAAYIVAFLTLAEIIIFAIFPQPTTVEDWFILFQDNPILGLLDYWGLELLLYAVFAIVFLALSVALKGHNKSAVAISLTFALLGIAVFFAANNPFSMFSLSRQYAAAAAGAHRSELLAAGEAVLAATGQRAVGGFNLGLFFLSISGLILSTVMLKAPFFGRLIAYLGLMAFGLSLADYLRQALTSSATIALIFIVSGALLLIAWFYLIGRRLWWFGRL